MWCMQCIAGQEHNDLPPLVSAGWRDTVQCSAVQCVVLKLRAETEG